MARKKQMNESKELITDALMRLLKLKPLTSISMAEIAKEADVVRMTLYIHFNKKEYIILLIIEKKIDQFMEQMGNGSNITIYDIYLFRFRILKMSPFTIMLYECNQLDKLFQLIRNHVADKLAFLVNESYDPFIINFFIGGIDKVTQKWIEDGMETPPEEMAKKVDELVRKMQWSLNE